MTDTQRVRPRLRPSLRAAVVVNMSIVAFSSATGGLSADLLQLYAAQTLGFSPAAIGTALALMLVSVPFQLAAPRLVRRLGYRKAMRAGYASALILLGALAALPSIADGTARYAAFVATVVAIEIVISCSWGAGWHAWMRSISAREERAPFLSAMRGAAQVFNLTLTTGFAVVVGTAVSASEYRTLLAVLAAALVLSLALLGRIESPAASSHGARAGLLGAVRDSMSDPSMRRLYLLVLMELFLLVPVMPLFLLEVLGLPASFVGVIVAVRGAAGAAATFAWRGPLDRWGNGRVVAITAWGLAFTTVALVPLTHWGTALSDQGWARPVVIALVVVGAVAGAGYATAMIGTWYDHVPDSNSVELFTIQDVLGSSRVQLGFLVSGWALGLLGGMHIEALGLDAFGLYLLLVVPAAFGTSVIARGLERSTKGLVP